MNLYATLDQYHAEENIQTAIASLTAAERMLIINALEEASRRIDTYCGRYFYPLVATNYYDYLSAWEIKFNPFDLLEATTVTTAGGDTEIDSDDYDLLTGDVYGLYPKNRLLVHTDASATLDIGTREEQANQILGIWGYHNRWGSAWLDSLDTVENNPLTAAGTSLTVNDADGIDAKGVSPRFQVGQLLQIEDEYVYVAVVNTSTNVLTIVRAQNGTDAAAHVQNTTVEIFQPMLDIRKACLIIASYFRELPSAPFGTVQSLEGTYQIKLTIPETAVEIIEPYSWIPIGTLHRKTGGRLYPEGIDPWRGR